MNMRLMLSGLSALLLICLAGCRGSAEYESDSLQLLYQGKSYTSGTEISLSNQKVVTEIEVKTNLPKWTVLSNSSWLTATQVGDYIRLEAEANNGAHTRNAQLVVNAGAISQSVVLRQEATGKLEIIVNPGTEGAAPATQAPIVLDETASKTRVVLRINAEQWSATSDAAWLQVVGNPRSGELLLSVTANDNVKPRTARITITSGEASQSIEVKQKGVFHLFLPIVKWGGDLDEIDLLERARRSKQVAVPNRTSSPTVKDYTYKTQSAAFPVVKYEFMNYGSSFLYAATLVGDPDLIYSEEFYALLREEGFKPLVEPVPTSNLVEWFRKSDQTRLYILRRTFQDGTRTGYVYLYPHFDQPQDYPTLDKLEYGVSFTNATFKAVKEWEEKNGGRYDDDQIFGGSGLEFFFAPEPFFARWYFFEEVKEGSPNKEPLMIEKSHNYYNHTRGVYRYGDLDFVTKEFNQLLTKEGFTFTYYNPTSRSYRYVNGKKRLALIVRSATMGPNRLLRLAMFEINETATANRLDEMEQHHLDPVLR